MIFVSNGWTTPTHLSREDASPYGVQVMADANVPKTIDITPAMVRAGWISPCMAVPEQDRLFGWDAMA